MTPIREDGLRYGAIAAGALALGAAATAGADKLIDGNDIADGSISARDLAPKAKSEPGSSLLTSSLTVSSGVEAFVGPGSDLGTTLSPSFAEVPVPPKPSKGFRARGLAVRAVDGKGSGFAGVTVTLVTNGKGFGPSCTTDSSGACDDSDKVNLDPGDGLVLDIVNGSKVSVTARVSLSLEPR